MGGARDIPLGNVPHSGPTSLFLILTAFCLCSLGETWRSWFFLFMLELKLASGRGELLGYHFPSTGCGSYYLEIWGGFRGIPLGNVPHSGPTSLFLILIAFCLCSLGKTWRSWVFPLYVSRCLFDGPPFQYLCIVYAVCFLNRHSFLR